MCLDAPKPAVQELPASLTWAQIAAACKDGRKLMVINGEVRSGRRDVKSTCAARCAARRVADDGAQRCAPPGDRCNRDLCALLQVYDVAGWVQKHPGGKVLLTYVGEDATDSVRAFHRDEEQMQKYLSPLRVAALAQEAPAAVRPCMPPDTTSRHTAPLSRPPSARDLPRGVLVVGTGFLRRLGGFQRRLRQHRGAVPAWFNLGAQQVSELPSV